MTLRPSLRVSELQKGKGRAGSITAPHDAVVEGTWEEFRQETNVFDSLFTELFLWLQDQNSRIVGLHPHESFRLARSAPRTPGTLISLCLLLLLHNRRNLHDVLNQTRIKAPVAYTNQPTYVNEPSAILRAGIGG